jgi:hypothetical protein
MFQKIKRNIPTTINVEKLIEKIKNKEKRISLIWKLNSNGKLSDIDMGKIIMECEKQDHSIQDKYSIDIILKSIEYQSSNSTSQ